MLDARFKSELKKLATSNLMNGVSKSLQTYEKKIRTIVDEINDLGKDAKSKSIKQIDKLSEQLKRTRTDLEKRVLTVLNLEAKRLNKSCNQLFDYLDSVTHVEEKVAAKKSSKSKKTAAKKPVLKSQKAKSAKTEMPSAQTLSN